MHPDFWVSATGNPYGLYSGRQPTSPAFKDRFQSYRIVPAADEKAYLDLGRLLVHGQQPDITVQGVPYRGLQEAAHLPRLAAVPGIDTFIEALSRLHVSLEAAAGGSGGEAPRLGAAQREPTVFTRRGYINTLGYLDRRLAGGSERQAAAAAWAALERYYFAKLDPAGDRAVAVELANAVGLNPKQWRT